MAGIALPPVGFEVGMEIRSSLKNTANNGCPP